MDVLEEVSAATVRTDSIGSLLTSRIERTGPFAEIETSGTITRSGIFAVVMTGTMPMSAVPSCNCAAQSEGSVYSTRKFCTSSGVGSCSKSHISGAVFRNEIADIRSGRMLRDRCLFDSIAPRSQMARESATHTPCVTHDLDALPENRIQSAL